MPKHVAKLSAIEPDPEVAIENADLEDMITTEMLERMEAALMKLPRLTREIFLAHRLDDLSYTEIAAITGSSTQRVEHEIARALIALDRGLCGEHLRVRWWERLW